MRVSSPFKDYYDVYQKYTFGASKIYNRYWSDGKSDFKYKNFYSNSYWIVNSRNKDVSSKYVELEQVIIGFCGKIHSYVLAFYYEEKHGKPRTIYKITPITSVEGLEQFCKLSKEEKRVASSAFFTEEDNSIFIKENCPIFLIKKSNYYSTNFDFLCCSMEKNRARSDQQFPLSFYCFDTFVNAEVAWTGLTSYIDFLGTQYKEIPEMTNETKIKSHGFDEMSFRKR